MTHDLRVGQAITVFGPGAVVDIGDESFVNCTIDNWSDPRDYLKTHAYRSCKLYRLSSKLGVRELFMPSTEAPGIGRQTPWSIRMQRFPSWMFCQSCRRMHQWSWSDERLLAENVSQKRGSVIPTCTHCRSKTSRPLVPMRWVRVCERGHLDDIDWNWGVHREGPICTNKAPGALRFRSRSKGGTGLAGLEVACSECGSARTIGQIISSVNGRQCQGGQPWLRKDDREPCTGRWQVSQRGDSNVHFPVVASALDIPESDRASSPEEWSGWPNLVDIFNNFKSVDSPGLILKSASLKQACEATGLGPDVIYEHLCGGGPTPHEPATTQPVGFDLNAIKAAEYPVLRSPDHADSQQFRGRSYRPSESQFGHNISELISSISLLDRLREVRAFRGFHRLKPGDPDRMVAAGPHRDWLPAYEVFGEGIFIDFNPSAITAWQSLLPSVCEERLRALQSTIAESGLAYLPAPDLPSLALHAFSHGLMRQLAFDCGYASSSLRERLYLVEDRHAILIYTAAGDSEGTLGGLVRMGDPRRFGDVIARTLREMAWCSSDPICLESAGQGISGLNEASCHACMLVSETSCELGNALLNRRLAMGDGDVPGLFGPAFSELEAMA